MNGKISSSISQSQDSFTANTETLWSMHSEAFDTIIKSLSENNMFVYALSGEIFILLSYKISHNNFPLESLVLFTYFHDSESKASSFANPSR